MTCVTGGAATISRVWNLPSPRALLPVLPHACEGVLSQVQNVSKGRGDIKKSGARTPLLASFVLQVVLDLGQVPTGVVPGYS